LPRFTNFRHNGHNLERSWFGNWAYNDNIYSTIDDATLVAVTYEKFEKMFIP
jgi:hypothetical protein